MYFIDPGNRQAIRRYLPRADVSESDKPGAMKDIVTKTVFRVMPIDLVIPGIAFPFPGQAGRLRAPKADRSPFSSRRVLLVSLSEVDRVLLQRCLDRAPSAWHDFADRFLGLVVHVANHTAEARGIRLDQATRDDLVAEVFLILVSNDFAVLRRFRRNCSLATYLTVISRRVIARRLSAAQRGQAAGGESDRPAAAEPSPDRMENREEVQKLLLRLDPQEASVVRMYHLEGKSYEEISQLVGMSENSIGPVLSRAREKMRQGN